MPMTSTGFAERSLHSASIFTLVFILCVSFSQLAYLGHVCASDEGPNCLFCLRRAVLGSSLRTDSEM